MGGLDIHNLSEQHQFVILLIVQVANLVSMFLLYRSHPKDKGAQGTPPNDGSIPTIANDPGPHS
jgi:hypothetical protein